MCTTKLMSSEDPLAETQGVATTATITAEVFVAGPDGESRAIGDVDTTSVNVPVESAHKEMHVKTSYSHRSGGLAKLEGISQVDSLPGKAVKPKSKKNSGGGKVVQKDEISGTTQASEEAKNDYFSAAQNQVIEAFGENPYTTWRNDKSQNKLASTEIGFNCETAALAETAFGDHMYPTCGMVIGKTLLSKNNDISIWVEAFYNEWDRLKKQAESKLKGNPLTKGFERMYYEKLNAAVRKMAEKSMTLIMNIKFVTPSSFLELKGAKPGYITETKITRISLMMGWVSDLEKAVDSAIKAFFKFLESIVVVKENMTSTRRKTVLTLLGRKIPDFGMEISHDSDGGDSPDLSSSAGDDDSESGADDSEGSA